MTNSHSIEVFLKQHHKKSVCTHTEVSFFSKKLFPFVVLFFSYLPTEAQKFTSYFPYLKYETDLSNPIKNKELGIIPIVYRTPETGFATGLLLSALFKMPGVTDSTTRTSNLIIPFIVTEYKQFNIPISFNLITNEEKWYFRGIYVLQDFNEKFWGIGNKSSRNTEELITYNYFRVTQRVLHRFYDRHFFGGQFNSYNVWNLKGGANMAQSDVIGNKGYNSSGIGLVYIYDTRDNIVAASKGVFIDVSTYSYVKNIASDYTFNSLWIDTRAFYSPAKGHTIGFNAVLNFNEGDVPFFQLSHMGGLFMMRGYYYGRYRDKIHTAFQSEYRVKIWKFLGATVFGAVGNVAKDLQEYDFNTFRYTYGAGIRLSISKRENANVRLDIGLNENISNPGIYLSVGEAF